MQVLARFDTLAARTILVLLVGITLVHLLSLWTYEQALDRELTLANEARLAERIVSIKRSVMLVPAEGRETVAHDFSGGPLEAHWSRSRGATPGGPGAARWQGLAAQIAALAPELAADDIAIGVSSESDTHVALVSLRLPDESWINVSLFAGARPPTSGHGSLLSTSLMALGVVGLSIVIARWLTRPLRSVATAAAQLSPDGPDVRLPVAGPREVQDLAVAFNDMQARIRDQIARRTQSLAAVSHDLRTPLTRLKLRIEDVAELHQQEAMLADIDEMEQMITATLSYLKGDDGREEARPIDVAALLGTLVNSAVDGGQDVALEVNGAAIVCGRLVSLRRALSNLLSNALRFGTKIAVRVETESRRLRIVIEDDGPGIPPDQLEAVLEPFVRLEDSRNRETGGVGLGLTIAKANIEGHGGTLELRNRERGGLRAIVELPMTPAKG